VSSSVEPSTARWPWVAFGCFMVVAATGMTFVVANDESVAGQVPYVIAFTAFGLVGAIISSRVRRNVIGFLLLYAAFTAATTFVASELTTWFVHRGATGLGVQLLALVNGVGWLIGTVPALLLIPLLFPDGRLPSPRWRPFLWLVVGSMLLVCLGYLLVATSVATSVAGSSDTTHLRNPLYVAAIARIVRRIPGFVGIVFPLMLFASLLSLFVRFRGAHGAERQQIKWVAFGLVVAFLAIVVLSSFIGDPVLNAFISGAGFLIIPVSIGIAVLRFRLYDLDVVVRKTVVYAALVIFATLVYLALVVGLGAWLGRGSSFLTMIAAVVVAVTFQPLRARLARVANRLVYGRRATPYEVLTEFSARVGGTFADEDLLERMARVLGEGVGAERADVWLKVDRELRDVAPWPPEAGVASPIPLANGAVPPIDGADRVYAVEHAGELLGALAVRKPSSDPVSPADDKLVQDLSSQAGLVLRNVRLTEDLKARLADLSAAQRRIVAAQDEARRRLEGNIHDGAQQQLVALTVKARLARTLAERDPPKATAMLTQIENETQDALENLRDLARGIYPPLLADKGLVAALEAQARKSVVPVTLDVGAGVGRYPQEAEAAAYFCALEALQNVAKYAEASRAEVHVGQDDGMLGFDVRDDGPGFDPMAATAGTGLQGMADRLAALGGTLEVTSAPGRGTTVSGRIPVSPVVVA
jgi:signal transduction histidine kinase